MEENSEFQGKATLDSSRDDGLEAILKAAHQVRADVERMVDECDLQAITHRVDELGRRNPLGLALVALSLGVMAGILLRDPQSGRSELGLRH
ncbi:MAG: hypothetical protein ACO3A2_01455 [Bdellovibrionia bacterium]